jgi:TIR domain
LNVLNMTTHQNSVSIFLSYAQEDERWLQRLETHLSSLKQQGLISTWDKRQIDAGTNWAKVIDEQLEQASIILLLVSANFLASGSCDQVEMQRALERHKAGKARVIPILLRPVDWKATPFAHLQALPTNAQAITTWKNKDEAFLRVTTGIRKIVEELLNADPGAVETIGGLATQPSPHLDSNYYEELTPPSPPPPPRQPLKLLLSLFLVVLVFLVAVAVGSFWFMRSAAPTHSSVGILLQVISQPNYANVEGTLISDSLSGQNVELRLSFVNNGKDACTGVKFHTLDLSNSSGKKSKPTSSIDQSWRLLPADLLMLSVQFQLPPGSGSQYTLTISLDVGGCATPHDNSPNRYANYQVEFSVNE